nr:MAG TPA: hypothetical protein [Caudoviricetes sp.]
MHMPLSGCSVWWWLASVALVQRRGLLISFCLLIFCLTHCIM